MHDDQKVSRGSWLGKHWRRVLVDMHIPDWDPAFLSQADPEKYVEMMVAGGATSAMVYTNSHVGLCYYPTKVGRMHRGLKGRDFFGSVLDYCHRRGLTVTAYHSLVFNNWAYVEHADWRIPMIKCNLLTNTRYGTCCPNSPYRDFALAQTREVCGYDCDSIFFDMTFWPTVCYCSYCVAKFRKETGLEPPRVVDWRDPVWVTFQRARERWITEFAEVTTVEVRKTNPKMTVTHQFSTVLHDWRQAVPFDLVDHCDYLSGDFYGESIQQSIVCKVFFNLSKHRPFEFHTSRCLDLTDHVSTKTPERLMTQAFLAPAHSSAFMFIDAIDPVGTLNPGTYSVIRSVCDKMAPYESELGGELVADVAVYFSSESKFDPADNGKPVGDENLTVKVPHWEAVLGACQSLRAAHIPFTVITRKNLADLKKYAVVVLPDVLVMSENEIEAMRAFVRDGGSLYASHRTSVCGADGASAGNFRLADVFGVSLGKESFAGLTFFTPVEDSFKQWIWPQDCMVHHGGQLSIETAGKVLATRTLPYTDPTGGEIFGETFASIHSNPPGPAGTQPAIVLNTFGKGKVVYAAGALEAVRHVANERVFAGLVRLLMSRAEMVRVKASPAFEVTVFDQPNRKRRVVSFLNSVPELVGVPSTIGLEIRMPEGRNAKQVVRLPAREAMAFSVRDGYVQATVSDVDVFAMVALEYE